MCDTAAELQVHLIEHSFAGQPNYKCYLCSQSYDHAQRLQEHMESHNASERQFSCASCGERFFFRTELDNHSLTHISTNGNDATVNGSETPDDKIEVRQTRSGSLHKRRGLEPKRLRSSSVTPHESEQKGAYQCQHCPKSFQSLAALQGHSHVHMTPIRNHHCLHCNKSFTTAAKLRNHQRQHRDGSPFVCNICGRTFSRKDNLKVHYRTHQRKVFGHNEDSSSPPPTMIHLTRPEATDSA